MSDDEETAWFKVYQSGGVSRPCIHPESEWRGRERMQQNPNKVSSLTIQLAHNQCDICLLFQLKLKSYAWGCLLLWPWIVALIRTKIYSKVTSKELRKRQLHDAPHSTWETCEAIWLAREWNTHSSKCAHYGQSSAGPAKTQST